MKKIITNEDLINALVRSGYIFESELTKKLFQKGFFVDPNQVIKDKITGKNREIDILAEYYKYNPERKNVAVKTHFIIEAVNNLFPLVLITERIYSPNTQADDYLKFIITPNDNNNRNHFIHNIDLYKEKNIYNYNPYSQYCSFTKKNKNEEIMAFHPDDIHNSFVKMCEYIDFMSAFWNSRKMNDEYWRVFFYKPILVLKNNLLLLTQDDKSNYSLNEIIRGKLEFNYYNETIPSTMLIDIVTEKGLWGLLEEEISYDENIEKKMWELKARSAKA
jgi:hypothetical protein